MNHDDVHPTTVEGCDLCTLRLEQAKAMDMLKRTRRDR